LNLDQGVLGTNLYTYCLNNPVNMVDPDGRAAAAIALSGSAFSAFCAWLGTIGGANFWNPVGWIIAGVLAAGVITWAAVSLYNSYKASQAKIAKINNDNMATSGNYTFQKFKLAIIAIAA
jgi:hypothetical protein